jgi:hypothetical protein
MDLTPFPGAPAAPPEVPGFRLHALLGFGAHGEVWRAEDVVSGDAVALKIGHRRARHPDPEGDFGDPVRSGPDYETALLSRIDHPHVVRLRRVVPLPDDGLALVLDLAAGGSLAALVAARGALPPEEVVTLIIPIVSALEHLHQSGLTHGDVAPGNILFGADGCPQLGDLGVARVLGDRAGEVWGTPGFTDPALLEMAGRGGAVPPEILRPADVWALAACCWFALTGHPPEPEALGGEPPEGLRQVLVRCLDPDPAARPGLAELADLAWQAARPAPIRLEYRDGPLSGEAGLPLLETLTTRRIPAASSPPSAGTALPKRGGEASFFGGAGRERVPPRRMVPVSRLLLLLVAVGLVGAVTAGVGWRALRAAGGEKVDRGGAVSSQDAAAKRPSDGVRNSIGTTEKDPSVDDAGIRKGKQLNAELAEALSRIGAARSKAFETVSASRLAQADESGSPAERSDRGLLERLRENGYRLEDLDFRIGQVRVQRVEGRTVDVSAVVSVSAHRQVRAGGDYAAGVAASKPAVMVFTLSAVGQAAQGAARWRVHDIRSQVSGATP